MQEPAIMESEADFLAGTYLYDSKLVSGEQKMWLGVIARVWLDAFEASDFFLKQTEGKASDPELVRGEARRWLVLDFGKWATDREMVSDLAGIDASMLRRAAKTKLAQIKADAKPTAEVIELDAMFAQLLDNERSMAAEDLDKALDNLATLEARAA